MEKNLSPTGWRLSAEDDLAATLSSGLTTKQRYRLKHCFHLLGTDRMAPTASVKELKVEWAKIGKWEWVTEALVCINVVEVLENRLTTLAKFGMS